MIKVYILSTAVVKTHSHRLHPSNTGSLASSTLSSLDFFRSSRINLAFQKTLTFSLFMSWAAFALKGVKWKKTCNVLNVRCENVQYKMQFLLHDLKCPNLPGPMWNKYLHPPPHPAKSSILWLTTLFGKQS